MPSTVTVPVEEFHLNPPSPAVPPALPLVRRTLSSPPRVWHREAVRGLRELMLHGYSTNVIQVLRHTVPEDQLLVGMELEINPESGWDRSHLLRSLRHIYDSYPYFICKTDGSVPRGIEVCTLPMSFDDMQELAISLLPLPARADRNCGIHFHVSKSALTTSQQWRMMQFIHNGEHDNIKHQFLNLVSRREPNTYCTRTQFYELPAYTRHYAALSMPEYKPTLEFRLFASTNKPLYLLSYIQFVRALVAYCADENQEIFDADEPHKFIAYVMNHRQLYPQLAARVGHAPFAAVREALIEAGERMPADLPTFGDVRHLPGNLPIRRGGFDGETDENGVAREIGPSRRRHPVTRERERRAQTTVPTTTQVRQWITNHFGVTESLSSGASRLRGRAVGYRSAQREYVRWYAENCVDHMTGERNYIRTQRGEHVRGVNDIRSHALYHLLLV